MDKFTIDINTNIAAAIEKILINGQRTVIVISKIKKVVGVISEGDILKSIIYKKTFNSSLSSIMNKNFKYLIYKNYTNREIDDLFLNKLCNLIPIVDKNFKLKEVISLKQYLKIRFKKLLINE